MIRHLTGLISHLDMLQIFAHGYIELGQRLQELGGVLYLTENEPDDPGRALSADELEEINILMTGMRDNCETLGLEVSALMFDRAINHPPKSSGELAWLTHALMSELGQQLFLFVPKNRAKWWEQDRAIPNFPEATKELVHSGNCFAAAEYVACVFHAMRATEIALTAVYKCLGLTPPPTSNRSWGNYCISIKDEIARRGKSWQRLDEFQEIHTTLVAVKDGWRNKSLHVDAAYSEPDALRILENVTFFIEKISSSMDEQGLPLA